MWYCHVLVTVSLAASAFFRRIKVVNQIRLDGASRICILQWYLMCASDLVNSMCRRRNDIAKKVNLWSHHLQIDAATNDCNYEDVSQCNIANAADLNAPVIGLCPSNISSLIVFSWAEEWYDGSSGRRFVVSWSCDMFLCGQLVS